MKNSLKRFSARILWFLGATVGYALSIIPFHRRLYRGLTVCNRELPDKFTLWILPFFTGLGMTLFDLREPIYENLVLVNGAIIRLDISEKTQRQIFSHKVFEASLSRFFISTLDSGDTVIDAGANVGYFTLLAAKAVGNNGRVIAIEPEKINFSALTENIHRNKFHHVTALKCALGSNEGESTLYIHPLNRGAHSLLPFGKYISGNVIKSVDEIKKTFGEDKLFERVSVRRLDDVAEEQNISSVKILKIDVEQFEYPLLLGAREFLKNKIATHVVCEVNNAETRSKVFSFFCDYGYKPYTLSFEGKPIDIKDADIKNISGGNVLFSRS